MSRLSRFDRAQGYNNETLAEGLAEAPTCRHLARIAHLYFARTTRLTLDDYASSIPKLLDKLLGACGTNDRGWLGLSADLPKRTAGHPLPTSFRALLVESLESQKKFDDLFSEKLYDKTLLGALRVYGLVGPFEASNVPNLFHKIFEDLESRNCVYLYPVDALPPSAKHAFIHKDANSLPNVYACAVPEFSTKGFDVCTGGSETSLPVANMISRRPRDSKQSIFIPLELGDYVALRFLTWHTSPGLSVRVVPVPKKSMYDVWHGKPQVELLFDWCVYFCGAKAEKRYVRIFFGLACDVLCTRHVLGATTNVDIDRFPASGHLDALRTLCVACNLSHVGVSTTSPKLINENSTALTPPLEVLRGPVRIYLTKALGVARTDATLCDALDVWLVYRLSPWRAKELTTPPANSIVSRIAAASSHHVAPHANFDVKYVWFVVYHYAEYVGALKETARACDSRQKSARFLLSAFGDGGAFCQSVLTTLLCVESIVLDDTSGDETMLQVKTALGSSIDVVVANILISNAPVVRLVTKVDPACVVSSATAHMRGLIEQVAYWNDAKRSARTANALASVVLGTSTGDADLERASRIFGAGDTAARAIAPPRSVSARFDDSITGTPEFLLKKKCSDVFKYRTRSLRGRSVDDDGGARLVWLGDPVLHPHPKTAVEIDFALRITQLASKELLRRYDLRLPRLRVAADVRFCLLCAVVGAIALKGVSVAIVYAALAVLALWRAPIALCVAAVACAAYTAVR